MRVQKSTGGNIVAQIGSVLRARRTTLGLSLDKLADESGVTRATICALEHGNGNPCVGTLSRLCGALKCKLVDLLK
jgi:transcriptional regulator with XRE-family HTH domain